MRVRGAGASNGLPPKGRLTKSQGKTRGYGRVGWEVGDYVKEGGGIELPTAEQHH